MAAFLRLSPFLTVLIAVFAVYQLVTALYMASRQQWPFAALYAVMAIAGAALARALWINRKKYAQPRE